MRHASLIICTLILCMQSQSAYAAESFLEQKNVHIAKHNKRKSPTKLFSSHQEKEWGIIFRAPKKPRLHPKHIASYRELPRCRASEVRRQEINSYTAGSKVFDMLYYDDSVAEHRANAKKYQGPARPYEAALKRDLKTKRLDYWQHFARVVQIDCLPSRFHFATIGKKRFIELRTGARAWDK